MKSKCSASLRRLLFLPALVLATCLPVRLAAQQTIAGNLNVTGTVDVDGNSLTLGTQGSSPGLSLTYADADTDTLTFFLNRNPGSWLWAHTASISAMRLTAAHDLILYKADGTTPGITLNPATSTLSFGATTLYRDPVSGALRTNGAVTVDGVFSASSFATSSGTLSGAATGLTLNAGGVNQNITLNPSGSGYTLLNGNVGIGTSTPQSKFHVHDTTIRVTTSAANAYLMQAFTSGGASDSIGIALHDGTTSSSPYLWIAKAGSPWGGPTDKMVIASTRNLGATKDLWIYANDNLAPSAPNLLVQANTGNVGIGTGSPAARLDVSGSARVQGNADVTGALTVTGLVKSQGGVALANPSGGAPFLINLVPAAASSGTINLVLPSAAGTLALTSDVVPGPQGPAGPAGPAGATGATGAQGLKGDPGATGPQGPVGPVGPAGSVGPAGPAGPQGLAGLKGDTGATGAAGATGAVGATGPQGLKGDTGAAGPQGPAGPAGAQGAVGAQGPAGPKGDTGAAGLAGPAGPQGPKGDAGVAGPAGPAGATGPQGAVGPQGAAGPKGDAGPAGAAGPQGPKGDAGAIGLPGPAGPAGPQGPAGLAGPQGLQGPAGAKGDKGEIGATGPAGAIGPQGPKGEVGATGPRGLTGLTGPQGATGAQGPTGPTGPRGPEGPRGLQGIQGIQGVMGPMGPQGPAGPVGVLPVRIVTGNTTLTLSDTVVLVDTPSRNDITVTLPRAVGNAGRYFIIKARSGKGDTRIAPHSGETIDGATKLTLNTSENVSLISDGATWTVLSSS